MSEIDLLKQRVSKLEDEIVQLKQIIEKISPTKSKKPENTENLSNLSIFEQQTYAVKTVLERFPYLLLIRDTRNSFEFNTRVPCPVCNKEHENENINGTWQGHNDGMKSYILTCWYSCYKPLKIITIKG